ncbi:Scr1 family TA system antitoxin-like transcriptional regulator [Plantactinospora sp. ZYX-F-223]|uniref:Scr1 family TA system antitoxin-like transcriptional regulator n=1 Tax=Plantactinospora sp. ZYX-F-223 TaxID=3144103 RepID=UPI0031FD2911
MDVEYHADHLKNVLRMLTPEYASYLHVSNLGHHDGPRRLDALGNAFVVRRRERCLPERESLEGGDGVRAVYIQAGRDRRRRRYGSGRRMQRQAYLYDTTKQFEFLLAEPVLRWLLCPPDVMRGQLDRLQTIVGLPNIRFGIVPMGVPLTTAPQHAVQLYDDLAIVDTFLG